VTLPAFSIFKSRGRDPRSSSEPPRGER